MTEADEKSASERRRAAAEKYNHEMAPHYDSDRVTRQDTYISGCQHEAAHHASELAAKDAEIERLKMELCSWKSEHDCGMEVANFAATALINALAISRLQEQLRVAKETLGLFAEGEGNDESVYMAMARNTLAKLDERAKGEK